MTPKRFNPYLDDERIQWLEEETKRQKLSSVSELLRRIIDHYRKTQGKG